MEHIHHGAEHTENDEPLLLCFLDFFALFQEVLHFLLFPVEDLGNFNAGKVFRKEGVHIRAAVRNRPVGSAGELLEHIGEKHHEGHEAQHDQGHCVVDEQHHHHNTDDHHGVLYQSDQHIGEHHGNGVGIVGDTGHQLAYGNVVQLLVGKAFDVGEHILTESRKKLLTDLLQDHGLYIHTDQRNDEDRGIECYHLEQDLQGEAFLLYQLLDIAHQHGSNQVVGNGDQHYHKNHDKLLFIGSCIVEKTANDLTVGKGAIPLVFLFFPLYQQISRQENGGGKADNGTDDQNG